MLGIVIFEPRRGFVIHTTMAPTAAAQHATVAAQLLERARYLPLSCAGSTSSADGQEVEMLCVRTRKHEMLMTASQGGRLAMLVRLAALTAASLPPEAALVRQRSQPGQHEQAQGQH